MSILPRHGTLSVDAGTLDDQSKVTFVANTYSVVFLIDLAPSLATVDAAHGVVLLDRLLEDIHQCLRRLVQPMMMYDREAGLGAGGGGEGWGSRVLCQSHPSSSLQTRTHAHTRTTTGSPGINRQFTPELLVSVVAQGTRKLPLMPLVHRFSLEADNVNDLLGMISYGLLAAEARLATLVSKEAQPAELHADDEYYDYDEDAEDDQVRKGIAGHSHRFDNNNDNNTHPQNRNFVRRLLTLIPPPFCHPRNQAFRIDETVRHALFALELLPGRGRPIVIVVSDGVTFGNDAQSAEYYDNALMLLNKRDVVLRCVSVSVSAPVSYVLEFFL